MHLVICQLPNGFVSRPLGDRGSTVVKVLWYKSLVRSQLVSLDPSDPTMALGSTQPVTEMSTRSISWA